MLFELVVGLGLLGGPIAQAEEDPPLVPHRIGVVQGSCLSVPQFDENETSTEWRGTVQRAGVLFWLLRINVSNRGLGRWRLTVVNPNGQVVDSLDSDTIAATSFEWWSGEVKDASVVQVAGDLRGLRFQIDQCVPGISEQELKSTIPPDDAKDIAVYRGEPLYQWGRSVARLKVLDAAGYFTCTAFLVAPDRLLTNEHCTSRSWKKMTAEFNAETGNLGQIDAVPVVEIIRTDPVVDIALLRLAKATSHPVARVASSDVPANATVNLVVVHHPSGKDKHASRDDCQTTIGGATGTTQFPHLCDTSKGSSGSPVFAAGDGSVVGLHRKGFREGTPGGRNQAVRASEINKFLQSGKAPAE